MKKTKLFFLIITFVFFGISLQGLAQIRSTRRIPGYRPTLPSSIYSTARVRVRAPIQTLISYPRVIPVYPSSFRRIEYQPARSNGSKDGDNESRIQSLENRLDNLESLAGELKNTLNNMPIQGGMSDEKYQRLLKVEEDMKSLRSILVELKNYMKRSN